MKLDLDTQTVINVLTEGIGAGFGRAARLSFYEQRDRLLRHSEFLELERAQQQALADLLAVACLYQCVVVPIECSGSFVDILEEAGATHLRVAHDRLDRAFANKAKTVATGFRVLLERSRIFEPLLTYASLKEFILQARIFYLSRQHGPVD